MEQRNVEDKEENGISISYLTSNHTKCKYMSMKMQRLVESI
jgi:hypothetical protein